MNDESMHHRPAASVPTDAGDETLARGLRQLQPFHHPAFTERLLLDWERAVRRGSAAAVRPGTSCNRLGQRRAHVCIGRCARGIALACALPLFVLIVQVAVSRIAEQAHMQQLVAPDALSELSFDLL